MSKPPMTEIIPHYSAGNDSLAPAAETQAERNPARVYLAGLAKSSRRPQGQALADIAGIVTGAPDIDAFPWAALRFQHTAAIRARLADSYSAATAKRVLSALRGTLKAAWRLGLIPADEYQKAVDLDPIRGETLPTGRALSAGEILALVQACKADPTPAGVRDAALLAAMYPGGLRREEVSALHLADYDRENGALTVRHGKGNKARTVYLTGGALAALAGWLALRGDQAGPLYYQVNKGGKILTGKGLTSQAIYNVLQKRGEQANVRKFSPHDLRRTMISDILDLTGDLSVAGALAGHSDPETTKRYDRRPETAKKKAAGMLHFPY